MTLLYITLVSRFERPSLTRLLSRLSSLSLKEIWIFGGYIVAHASREQFLRL